MRPFYAAELYWARAGELKGLLCIQVQAARNEITKVNDISDLDRTSGHFFVKSRAAGRRRGPIWGGGNSLSDSWLFGGSRRAGSLASWLFEGKEREHSAFAPKKVARGAPLKEQLN
jgi:hypothetical protein